MIKLLYEGGPIFTVPMTLLFLFNLVLAIRYYLKQASGTRVEWIRNIGVILLSLGILGQIIGLYEAFQAIERMQVEISPNLMIAGIRVSSITTLLGLTYFILSYVIWAFLRQRKTD